MLLQLSPPAVLLCFDRGVAPSPEHSGDQEPVGKPFSVLPIWPASVRHAAVHTAKCHPDSNESKIWPVCMRLKGLKLTRCSALLESLYSPQQLFLLFKYDVLLAPEWAIQSVDQELGDQHCSHQKN